MTMLLKSIEDKIYKFIKKYLNYILGGLLGGILTYFMMMALNLVNDLDGIWHLSNFIAGDWEISLGRGLQRYADRARFGIVSDSFNSILTLLLIAFANALILTKFDINNISYKALVVTILVANPVTCNSLSYSYMSVNFGLAYFFSIAAFTCINSTNVNRKNSIITTLISGAFLGISMAFYQAYICVLCVLIVIFILKLILEKQPLRSVFQYILSCIGTLTLGGVLYLTLTNVLLYKANIQLSSYKGASNANLALMIKHLPYSIRECYIQFKNYLYHKKTFANLEFINVVLTGLLIIYILAIAIQLIKIFKHGIMHGLLFVIMIILLPVASCFVLLLAVGNTITGLMSMGLLLSIVMLCTIIPSDGKTGFWMSRLYLLFLAAFAWFQLSATINDQLALKEGKTATITLADHIITQIYDEGFFEEYQTIAFVGRPANNDRFAQSTAYAMANEYAQFGNWSTNARNNRVSWEGVITNFLGININLCGDLEYQELITLEQVANMPLFPSKGSICIINDTIVVKVSNVY